MVSILTEHILTPLANGSEQNLREILAGHSALRSHTGLWGLPEPFAASLFSDEQKKEILQDGFTFFESLCLFSIRQALKGNVIGKNADKTGLILSTTKGNVGELENGRISLPGDAARKIESALGLRAQPVVVSNACISGVSALILGERLIEEGIYDRVIVCGCDVQNKFTVSGFQSLKALAAEPCRPFDMERTGLNLGEAVATVVLEKEPGHADTWRLENGAVRNDACHITTPARDAAGACAALKAVLKDTNPDDLGVVNTHGTATLFNDQMESVALERVGLSHVPANGLKGYYGHTMGAAGILETILTLKGLESGIIPGTRGLEEVGVSGKVCLSSANRQTGKSSFIKMISGFGGCNAAIRVGKSRSGRRADTNRPEGKASHWVRITPDEALLNDRPIPTGQTGKEILKELYKKQIDDYPRFYRMDALSRLGFVASELLLNSVGEPRFEEREDRAVIFFNRTGSLHTDLQYQATISDSDRFFPSPSVFVYTLPNIVTGEIAIRNRYHGETSFYVLPEKDEQTMERIIRASFLDKATRSILAGWVEYLDDTHFEAEIRLYR